MTTATAAPDTAFDAYTIETLTELLHHVAQCWAESDGWPSTPFLEPSGTYLSDWWRVEIGHALSEAIQRVAHAYPLPQGLDDKVVYPTPEMAQAAYEQWQEAHAPAPATTPAPSEASLEDAVRDYLLDSDEVAIDYHEAVYLVDVLRKRIGKVDLYNQSLTPQSYNKAVRRLIRDAGPLHELAQAVFLSDNRAAVRRWRSARDAKKAGQRSQEPTAAAIPPEPATSLAEAAGALLSGTQTPQSDAGDTVES